jgi:hypothetical protein
VKRGWAAAATAAGLLLLLVTLPNLGPSVRAGRAEGTRGTFVAEELSCVQHPGHEQCSWSGTFRVPGGAARDGYHLYGAGRGDLREGEAVPALDVGRPSRVYPPSGSREWMITGGLAALGVGLLAVGGRGLVVARRKAYVDSSRVPAPT